MQKPANILIEQQSSDYPVTTHSTLCARLMSVATTLDVPSVFYKQLISDIKRLSGVMKQSIDGDDGDGCEEHDDDDHVDDNDDGKSPKLEMPKERDQMYFKSPLF